MNRTGERKLNWMYLPDGGIEGAAGVAQWGAEVKHHPYGWKHITRPADQYMQASRRHMSHILKSITDKEDALEGILAATDEESGLLAIDHLICDLAFLRDLIRRSAHLDQNKPDESGPPQPELRCFDTAVE